MAWHFYVLTYNTWGIASYVYHNEKQKKIELGGIGGGDDGTFIPFRVEGSCMRGGDLINKVQFIHFKEYKLLSSLSFDFDFRAFQISYKGR